MGEQAVLPPPPSLRLSWCAPHLPSFTSVSLTLSLCNAPPPSPPLDFSLVTHSDEFSLFLTDKSAPVAAELVNQGALHAQRDKVNDKKIKRGRGSDLPSQVAACAVPGLYLLG